MHEHDNSHHPLPARLLGIWAHPDDESYLSAGLMADVIDNGGTVTVLALSDGELGFADDDPRTVAARIELRRAELRAAMAALGVTDVRFVGAPDGALNRLETHTLAAPIVDLIDEIRPDLIVTFGPDGITGHEDHIAAGLAATWAWLERPSGELHYAATPVAWLDRWRELNDRVGVWMAGEPKGCEPHEVERSLLLSGERLSRKRAALAGHASQTVGVAGAFGEAAYLEWISEETFRRPTARELDGARAAVDIGCSWPMLARLAPVVVS